MKEIHVDEIISAIRELCIAANTQLGEDVKQAFEDWHQQETDALAKCVLSTLSENSRIAEEQSMPMCQDTGFAVVMVEMGQEVHIQGGLLEDAIHEGVRRGYKDGYLRNSIVHDPFDRKNTGDNTPAVIHYKIVEGEDLILTMIPKGGGSENMSEARLFPPGAGWGGVKDFVVNLVKNAGAKPCPPIIVGLGLGGTMEKAAALAKHAILRELGSKHSDPAYAAKEKELLEAINQLNIGPQGFGGKCTALGVFIETFPCHIASLPVAVNIQCHAARWKRVRL